MTKRKTTNVVHNKKGGWDVKKGGQDKPVSHHRKKSTAIDKARSPVKKDKVNFISMARMEKSSRKTAMAGIPIRQKDKAW